MFSNLRGSEWLILILVIVLLFGARRLPDAARGLGRSLRIFKAETKGLGETEAKTTAESAGTPETAETPEAKAVDAAAPQPSQPAATDQATGKQTPTQP